MSFISGLKAEYTQKRINKIKELEVNLNKQEGSIKSNNFSPNMVVVEKKTPLRAFPTMLSIGRNIDYSFKSLKNNPKIPQNKISSELLNEFEENAHSLGIMSIGYTKITPEIIFKDKSVLYENTIVLTKEIDKNAVDNEFNDKTVNDLKLYDELGKITNRLVDYLRINGFGAQASHPAIGSVTYPALAQYAGLGWKGKNNLLITPELGPRQKITAIFTSIDNLPFNKNNQHSWIPKYCNMCGKCITKCPEQAIKEIKTNNEIYKSKITPELCRGCNESCTICMSECPFNKQDYGSVKKRFEKINKKSLSS
ncbi:MAG: 4Fe-4S binding protein [Methanobacterium sp.]|nr:4Fe-4S binding protein [Methanobacterium sp.]